MTTVAPVAPRSPQSAGPGEASVRRGSLARAEIRRFRSRRFIRVLLALAAVGYVLAIGVASTKTFGKTTPDRLAAAQRNVQQAIQQQDFYRQQCLRDANRPANVPDEQVCGPPASADNYRAEDFLDRRPFVLATRLPEVSLPVAVATAALAFLIGATYIGAEWSSRSIVALLFWEPRRVRVMAVKLAVLTAAAALLGVLTQALWWGTARLMAAALGTAKGLPSGFYGHLLQEQGRGVALVVLAALLGFAFSNLVRNTGAALGVGFVYFAVVESAVRGIHPAWQQWLLTDNAVALVQPGGFRLFLFGPRLPNGQRELLLSNLHGGLVLGLVTLALVTLGVLAFSRRDLS